MTGQFEQLFRIFAWASHKEASIVCADAPVPQNRHFTHVFNVERESCTCDCFSVFKTHTRTVGCSCSFHFHDAHIHFSGQPPRPSLDQLCPQTPLPGKTHQQTPGPTGNESDSLSQRHVPRLCGCPDPDYIFILSRCWYVVCSHWETFTLSR